MENVNSGENWTYHVLFFRNFQESHGVCPEGGLGFYSEYSGLLGGLQRGLYDSQNI